MAPVTGADIVGSRGMLLYEDEWMRRWVNSERDGDVSTARHRAIYHSPRESEKRAA